MLWAEIDPESVPFYTTFDEEEVESICSQLVLMTQMVYQYDQNDGD